MKKIFKYATGEQIPEGAIYLSTIKNGLMNAEISNYKDYYYVWHYFLVEIKDKQMWGRSVSNTPNDYGVNLIKSLKAQSRINRKGNKTSFAGSNPAKPHNQTKDRRKG